MPLDAPNQNFRALTFLLLSPFQEQEMGNYKQAHQLLFRTYQDLKSQQLALPQELWRRLMLLHSYVPWQCTAMTAGQNQLIIHSNHSTRFDAVESLHFNGVGLSDFLLFKSKDLMNYTYGLQSTKSRNPWDGYQNPTSQVIVKRLVKAGDHPSAAIMLVRVAKNIQQFPAHVVPILTSVVIECQRAKMIGESYQYACTLMKPEYRKDAGWGKLKWPRRSHHSGVGQKCTGMYWCFHGKLTDQRSDQNGVLPIFGRSTSHFVQILPFNERLPNGQWTTNGTSLHQWDDPQCHWL